MTRLGGSVACWGSTPALCQRCSAATSRAGRTRDSQSSSAALAHLRDGSALRMAIGSSTPRRPPSSRIRVAGAPAGALYGLALRANSPRPPGARPGPRRAVERLGGSNLRGDIKNVRAGYTAPARTRRPCTRRPRRCARPGTIVLAGRGGICRNCRRWRRPVDPGLLADRPDRAAERRPVGGDRLGRATSASPGVHREGDYLSRTADRRASSSAVGARPTTTTRRLGRRVRPARADPRDAAPACAELWFPVLRDVRFTHAWGGPLGMPARLAADDVLRPGRGGIATARGYTGQGVSDGQPLGARPRRPDHRHFDSPLTALPTVGHRSPDWEPEPLRWLGIRYVPLRGYLRIDAEGRAQWHAADRADAGGAARGPVGTRQRPVGSAARRQPPATAGMMWTAASRGRRVERRRLAIHEDVDVRADRRPGSHSRSRMPGQRSSSPSMTSATVAAVDLRRRGGPGTARRASAAGYGTVVRTIG